MTYIIFFSVSIFASIIGAICGVGGGVFMKPVLDAVGVLPVNTITFLSGCTVISMTGYNVVASAINNLKGNQDNHFINWQLTTWLAIGSALGGIVGKHIYMIIQSSFENKEAVGGYQAIALFVIVLLTLIYTVNKSKVKTLEVSHPIVLMFLGFVLGSISSFLGIGGGPMNLAVLFLFLPMSTKAAAQNSLYMILISQSASLIMTFVQRNIPYEFFTGDIGIWVMLIGMMICGICGGKIGKKINERIPTETVDKLFVLLMIVILGLCVWNTVMKFDFIS